MATPRIPTEFTPAELRESLSNVDPETLGTGAAAPGSRADEGGRPAPDPAEIAEQARLRQQARPESRPDRDDKLVSVGRGEQTAGRQRELNKGG